MLINKILNLIFPLLCLHCQKSAVDGEVLCPDCLSGVKLNQTLFCGKCGLRLPAVASAKAGLVSYKKICHQDYPYLLGSAADYGEVMKSLIHGLKFRLIRKAAEPLGRILIRYVEGLSLPMQKFIVVPIPLSGARLRERGFNQSELIAKVFAEYFNLRLETKLLFRTKNTKPQSETKNLAERQENIHGCFIAQYPEYIRGKNIFLIDDVATSGTTLFEAAKILKSSGAKKIIALTAARA